MTPRVFIGTLYCREGDFEESSRLITVQEHVAITHHIIANLPEKDAHNILWNVWNSCKSEYDLFIKVDADTVLRDEFTVSRIWQLFAADPRVTAVQAPLFDYMTNSMINGLNCFSPRVIFNPSRDGLYCDRGVDTGHELVLRQGQLPKELEPAGLHCFHASEKQAFHYGVHRALKNQNDIIERVKIAWTKLADRTRGMALVGAQQVTMGLHTHNYGDPEFERAFEECLRRYDETQNHSAR